jgi:sulfate-transporting ATPase
MSEFIQFAILGLTTGGVYALLALAVVAVHRTSGAVNFATGAMAVASGYLFLEFKTLGLSSAVAFVCSIASGIAVGMFIETVVMRPLRTASALTKAIATLGLLVIIQSGCQLKFGTGTYVVTAFLPVHRFVLFGAHLTTDYVIIFGLSAALATLLGLFYRRTRLGLATSALAENEEALEGVGWSARMVALVNWSLAGALTALAGVLTAPITGLQLGFMTSLLVAALAAALFGGLSSFPLTFVGAVGIGIIQSELTYYAYEPVIRSLPGLADAVPVLIIILILAVRGRALPSRGFVGSTLPKLGTGRVHWPVLVAVVGLTALCIEVILPVRWVIPMTTSMIAGCILLSLIVLIGYAGQLSLMQASIGSFCALLAARLVEGAGWPLPLACLVGVAAAIPVGLVVGLPAVRTRGVTLAVVTLGLAEALNSLLFTTQSFAGGDTGISVGSAHLFGFDVSETDYPRRYSMVALVLFVALGVAVVNLRRSAIGRKLIAVRSNERAAASLGLNVPRTKLYAFVLSGGIAAVAGMLVAFRYSSAVLDNVDPLQSINYVVEAVVGGVGYVFGGVAGTGLEPAGVVNTAVNGIGLGNWLTFIGGILLVVTVILNPDGIVGGILLQLAWIRRRLGIKARQQQGTLVTINQAVDSGGRRSSPLLLSVDDVSVRFGSVTAVSSVSFSLASGQVLGIIGPNGAGKTTLIDAISGYAASEGTISIDGRSVDSLTADKRNRAGITRSFQSLELFEDLTVGENLLVASERRSLKYWLTCLARPGKPQLAGAAAAAVTEFHLENGLQSFPNQLSYAQRRLLAIARAVATEPRLLMLDEPAAGLGDKDRQELKQLIRTLADKWDIAVLLIEHDVDLVMSVSDQMLALDFGEIIAHGTPDEIRANPDVIRSYLGEEDVPAGAEVPSGAQPPSETA